MESFPEQSTNSSFVKSFNYKIEHSSFYIENNLSSFDLKYILSKIKDSGILLEESEIKSNHNDNSNISKTFMSGISYLINKYQEYKDENKTLKMKVQELENNLSSIPPIFMSKSINNYKNNDKEKIEIQDAEEKFFEDMRKKYIRANKLNKKIKKYKEKLKEKEKDNSNISLIQERELNEKIKIKFKYLSEDDKKKIQKFRKEYNLNEEDYSNEVIFNALFRNNYEVSKTFESLFS